MGLTRFTLSSVSWVSQCRSCTSWEAWTCTSTCTVILTSDRSLIRNTDFSLVYQHPKRVQDGFVCMVHLRWVTILTLSLDRWHTCTVVLYISLVHIASTIGSYYRDWPLDDNEAGNILVAVNQWFLAEVLPDPLKCEEIRRYVQAQICLCLANLPPQLPVPCARRKAL